MGHEEGEETGAQPAPRLLSATHALLSAADEMPDAGLAALSCCCNPETLLAVECLLRSFLSGGEACLGDGALSALTDEETLRTVELLFSSCSIALQRGPAALVASTGQQPGFLPLALSAAVTGLAALGAERG
nr:PREDICTED: non-syndromic hearing impairment protein 5 homolog [Lepisosteus oculatus]